MSLTERFAALARARSGRAAALRFQERLLSQCLPPACAERLPQLADARRLERAAGLAMRRLAWRQLMGLGG